MGAIASQITILTIVYLTVYLDEYQRKHQSSASPAFVRRIHREPVNSPHKWPVTRKMFPFDDVIMMPADDQAPWASADTVMTMCLCCIYMGSVLEELQWPGRLITNSDRGKIAAIFQTTFSIAFSWMKITVFRWKFNWNLFPSVPLTIFQHCLAPARQQAIIWTNADPIPWRAYASLGTDELRFVVRLNELLNSWNARPQQRTKKREASACFMLCLISICVLVIDLKPVVYNVLLMFISLAVAFKRKNANLNYTVIKVTKWMSHHLLLSTIILVS